MKMNAMVKKALSDKNVLYVVLFIACAVLLGYLVNNDFESVIFFCVVGFLLSQFSKNMTVVLGGTVIATSLFKSMRVGREGMTQYELSDTVVNELQSAKGDKELEKLMENENITLKDGVTLKAFKAVLDDKDNDKDLEEIKAALEQMLEAADADASPEKEKKEEEEEMRGMEANRGMRPSRRAAQRANAGGASLDANKNEKTLKMAGNMIDRLEGMLGRVEKFGGMFGGGN